MALRSDKVEANAKVQVLEKELKNTLLQLHAVQLQLHSTTGTNTESDAIKLKLVCTTTILFCVSVMGAIGTVSPLFKITKELLYKSIN